MLTVDNGTLNKIYRYNLDTSRIKMDLNSNSV